MAKPALDITSAAAALDQSAAAISTGEYLIGLQMARAARQAAFDQSNELLYTHACALEAIHLARGGSENQARELAQQILPSVDRLCGSRRSIEIRNVISRCYVNNGDPIKALPFALDSLTRSHEFGDDVMLAWAYCRLGSTYGALQHYQRCISTLEKAIEYAEKTSDDEVKFGSYQNLANNLRWSIDFQAQIHPLDTLGELKTKTATALAKASELAQGNALRELYVFRTEAGFYSVVRDTEALSRTLKKYELICGQLNNSLHSLIAKTYRTHLMLLEGKAHLAAEFIEKELDSLQAKIGDFSTNSELLKVKYRVYRATGENDKAVVALEAIHRENLVQMLDTLQEQSQLLMGEIEVIDAKHEAKEWREQSENSALQIEKERQAARHDILTGLLNRRAFEEDIATALLQMNEGLQQQRALAVIDVDHFKNINDTFGHEVGDQVLSRIAKGLQDSVRGLDKVYRYGGEEFVILVNLETSNDLIEFCERTRSSIAQMDWTTQLGSKVNRLTVSVGATLLSPTDNAKSVVIRADQAMYQAKQDGRNLTRLVLAQEPFGQPHK